MIEREVKRIRASMVDFADDTDLEVKEAARQAIRDASTRKQALLRERDELSAELARGIPTPEEQGALIQLAEKLRGKLERATPNQKRQVIELLNVEVRLLREGTARVKSAALSFVLEVEPKTISPAQSEVSQMHANSFPKSPATR